MGVEARHGSIEELEGVGDAAHLVDRNPSKYENFVEPSVTIGAKSTIGPGCIVEDAVVLAEKCSVKRSRKWSRR